MDVRTVYKNMDLLFDVAYNFNKSYKLFDNPHLQKPQYNKLGPNGRLEYFDKDALLTRNSVTEVDDNIFWNILNSRRTLIARLLDYVKARNIPDYSDTSTIVVNGIVTRQERLQFEFPPDTIKELDFARTFVIYQQLNYLRKNNKMFTYIKDRLPGYLRMLNHYETYVFSSGDTLNECRIVEMLMINNNGDYRDVLGQTKISDTTEKTIEPEIVEENIDDQKGLDLF